ncbi:hypothetical protein Tco_1487902 [Tanacetum coccineum]
MVVQAPPPPTIIPPTTTITPPPTTTIAPITTTTPPTTTSPTPTSTPNIPTTSVQPSQPRKQRIKRRRDTEVTQPSEPTMVDDDIVPNKSNDPLSGEDRLQLTELMNFCTTLQSRVHDLEQIKSSQQLKIESLERRGRRIADIDEDAEVTLVDEVYGRRDEGNEMMFDAEKDLSGEEVVVEKVAEMVLEKEVAEEVNLNENEITLAQILQKLKSTPKAKGVAPKSKGIFINEPSETHVSVIPKQKNLDKGKGKMDEIENPMKLSRKEQISFDEEEARRLQALFDEEARMVEEAAKKEAQLVEQWDNMKAKMDADYDLASKLQ